jgi:acetylornithine deacetylase/succinyl-diaminopimelate desuccinylase-like protein
MTKAHEHAAQHAERYLEELFELLRIPSVSTDPARRDEVRRAAEWVADDLKKIGVASARVMETGGHPVVFAEWSGAPAGAPTVLVYGHYDVQPAEMADGWSRDPFTPAVVDGRIVARGATDDKGQVVAHLKAAESLLATGGCPVNLKYLLEGEEESGSANLSAFVKEHRELLAADVCLISDTGIEGMDQPSLAYGLRGLVALEIVVKGPKQDLHSGLGGCLHNPVQALAEIVAALHDEDGRVAVPGFYDAVLVVPPEEREMLARAEMGEEVWAEMMGDLPDWGEPGYSRSERMGIRPTLEVNGISGGYAGEGFKTVIGKRAVAKISCRLVPDQVPERIFELVRDRILALALPTVACEVVMRDGGPPALTDREHPAMQAAVRAYGYHWPDREVLLMRGGGSIPVVATIQESLSLPVVLLGFGLPDCGAHGPDENLPVVMFNRAIDTIIQFMHEVGSADE